MIKKGHSQIPTGVRSYYFNSKQIFAGVAAITAVGPRAPRRSKQKRHQVRITLAHGPLVGLALADAAEVGFDAFRYTQVP